MENPINCPSNAPKPMLQLVDDLNHYLGAYNAEYHQPDGSHWAIEPVPGELIVMHQNPGSEFEEWVLGTNAETYHDVAVFRCGRWYFRDPADGRDRACQWAECLWYFRDYFTVGL